MALPQVSPKFQFETPNRSSCSGPERDCQSVSSQMGPNPYALVVTGEESTRKWVMVHLYLYALVIGHGNQYGEEGGGEMIKYLFVGG